MATAVTGPAKQPRPDSSVPASREMFEKYYFNILMIFFSKL
jgi:hypothetical protein